MKGCGGRSDVPLCMHAPLGAYAYIKVRYSPAKKRDKLQRPNKAEKGFVVESVSVTGGLAVILIVFTTGQYVPLPMLKV